MSQPSPAQRTATRGGVRGTHQEHLVVLALGYLLAVNLLVLCLQWTRQWSIPGAWYWLLVGLDIALPVSASVVVVRQREPMPHADQLLLDRLPAQRQDGLRRAVRRREVSNDPHETALQVAMARSMASRVAWQLPWYMTPAALWPAVNLTTIPPHGVSGLLSLACWAGAVTSWANGRGARRFLATSTR